MTGKINVESFQDFPQEIFPKNLKQILRSFLGRSSVILFGKSARIGGKISGNSFGRNPDIDYASKGNPSGKQLDVVTFAFPRANSGEIFHSILWKLS